ncbi:unnamed protein product [Parnassius mnemosyne]|uniref:RNase H type-1 domain-containing protein n=1 Tax=Parnassius mnemosyne TaxID=213953 RepID=A0AAV1M941_9NEOP
MANILSDSKSALESLTNPNALHPLAAKILERMRDIDSNQGKVRLFWIKAHCGIPGNERADELAKSAAETLKQTPVYDCFPLSFAKRSIRDKTLHNWQERYTTAQTGQVTKKFFTTVKQAYKTMKNIKINNMRCQIFTGHGGFKAYLCKFKLAQSPCCDCDQSTPQTVEHVLIDCPKYAAQRISCEHRMGFAINETTLCKAINDNDSYMHFLEFAEHCLKKVLKENGSKVY